MPAQYRAAPSIESSVEGLSRNAANSSDAHASFADTQHGRGAFPSHWANLLPGEGLTDCAHCWQVDDPEPTFAVHECVDYSRHAAPFETPRYGEDSDPTRQHANGCAQATPPFCRWAALRSGHEPPRSSGRRWKPRNHL